jgi:hypothetical protein
MSSETAVQSEKQFATAMVEKYRDMLLACAGLKQITIDGQIVAYADLETNYAIWQKKLARLNNTRPNVLSIDLRNAQ